MAALATIFDYLREFAPDLGKRITEAYQPLPQPNDKKKYKNQPQVKNGGIGTLMMQSMHIRA